MLTQHQKAFLKCLGTMERGEGLRQYEAYSAFLELAFCATAKVTVWGEQAEKLEARYMGQVRRFRHQKESAGAAADALRHLVDGLETQPGDFLGEIHMELGGNPHTGQFFTPWALCQMMAEMQLDDELLAHSKDRILTVQEPACGCGAMVLAFAEALKSRGVNPATQCHFDLIDVDLRCVQAAYLQCTLMGLSATVHHGNTLSFEFHSHWDTFPAIMHPKRFRIAAQQREAREAITQERQELPAPPPELPNSAAAAPPRPQAAKPLQLSLLDL